MPVKKKKVTKVEIVDPEKDTVDQLFQGLDMGDLYCDVHRLYPLTLRGKKISGLLDRLQPPFDLMDIKEKFGGGVFKLNVKNAKNQFVRSGKVEIAGPPKSLSDEDEEPDKRGKGFELAETPDFDIEDQLADLRSEVLDLKKLLDGSGDMDNWMKKVTGYAILIRSMDQSKEYLSLLMKLMMGKEDTLLDAIKLGQTLSGEGEKGSAWMDALGTILATALQGKNAGNLLEKFKTHLRTTSPETPPVKPGSNTISVPEIEKKVEAEARMGLGNNVMKHLAGFSQVFNQILDLLFENIQKNTPPEDLAKKIKLIAGPDLIPWIKEFPDEQIFKTMCDFVGADQEYLNVLNEKKDYVFEVLKLLKTG